MYTAILNNYITFLEPSHVPGRITKKAINELVILTLHQNSLYNMGYINFMTYSLSNGVKGAA